MTYHIRVRAGSFILQNDCILLVEFNDQNGAHYNLPAGGVEPGESVKEAAKREAKEEASVDVEVGELAFVYEYAPHLSNSRYGQTPSLGMMFEASILHGVPSLSATPDANQTDVKWIPLSQLNEIVLYPNIKQHILEYVKQKRPARLIEEHTLSTYN
ncbi:ADP-ribose pyrophosphatase YjhB (NUDIX family) [Salirhabdus euzebyi]|uniref:ADP-ribose pyrophosphatase YjhB (NUDIX family) n=1 Tax=Salirhabdus euzebyi TaxID=394506 RepID=A0A841Q2E2_9BACI|nr:NUDIX domain-containing protein [Salirhabdus euzebyi]MBB6452732.1 ADP-ribose pyrophosphatase YjhB (NUDIX family) [Salirhabdus euzebyi]